MTGTTERRRRWPWALALLALAALAAWSVAIEPRWVAERRLEHSVPGWERPPLRVAVASDWHLTRRAAWVMTPERARRIVDDINAARPDVVLLLGDFIADRDYAPTLAPTAGEEIAQVLGRLRAPLGVYAVLGNHDWADAGGSFVAALRARGIRVLENQAWPLDAGLWLAGIGDHSSGRSRPAAALAGVPPQATVIAFMHDPASLRDLPARRGLALAGHTHGGQVRLPALGAVWLPGEAPLHWAYGWISDAPMPAFVTSGLGVSILPLRFNARPEWLLITLDAAIG